MKSNWVFKYFLSSTLLELELDDDLGYFMRSKSKYYFFFKK